MCGYAGLFSKSPNGAEGIQDIAIEMAATLKHRGPDSSGVWSDVEAGIAFAFHRLAILDLSPSGHQPMTSASGRYTVAYNGELYNHKELRDSLAAEGHSFRGSSDTEVLIEAVDEWGLAESVTRINGMFSFAVWDAAQNSLHLVRDRLGIKPLYYGQAADGLVFASELSSLVRAPGMPGEEDPKARALYFQFGYVPAPFSILSKIRKLQPGDILTATREGNSIRIERGSYWSLGDVVSRRRRDGGRHSRTADVEDLEELLLDAVSRRTMADVPVGAFLSGGTDSSLVVSLMQAATSRPIRTFTIAFPDTEFDESTHARRISEHLGTAHTELPVTEPDLFEIVPKLGQIYNEPFADPSQIPTVLLSDKTRRHVTVSLSGDGGDELFGGYHHYREAARLWRLLKWTPRRLRRRIGRILRHSQAGAGMVSGGVDRLVSLLGARDANPDDIVSLLHCESCHEVYRELRSVWSSDSISRELDGPSSTGVEFGRSQPPESAFDDQTERSMFWDTVQYLPDDILTKVDRASMHVSLEVRVPLLDHRVVEAAWRLPPELKMRNGEGKWVLKNILGNYLPKTLIEKPKQGFNVPLVRWLQGPLRPWAEDLIEDVPAVEPTIAEEVVRRRWQELQEGTRDWSIDIWTVLVYLSWRREYH